MQGLLRRAVTSIVAVSLLVPQGGAIPAVARSAAHHAPVVALASPPQRIAVREPVRVKPTPLPASAMRAHVVAGLRASGIRGNGPPMLRPREIDGVLAAARKAAATFASSSRRSVIHPAPAVPAAPTVNAAPGAAGAKPGPIGRRVQSLPSDSTASGTGINPWWRYQEQNVSGGGHVMVNVGTGNMLLQDDDMSVPHKGIALAFRRTYNSQSGHDVNATDAAGFVYEPPGMYGNGWTNTFDAHIARNAALSVYSIFDIDGARYDYDATWPTGNPNGIFTPRAGNHAMLAYDGMCGYLWTKKSGTTYYFYAPGPHAPCPNTGGSTEGYTGRLYQIVGRNRNTYLTFSYSWDGGNSSLTGKISQITAQTESGLTATLAFGDVNGHRLLQQLTYPDANTSVSYGYDALGDLTNVSSPPNNASGIRPQQSYGYTALGGGTVMAFVVSPRWNSGCATSGCGSDGGSLVFGFSGSAAASSTLATIQHDAVVNPATSDGTNSALQAGYSTAAFGYLVEYYTTGVLTPTYRDTDGHVTNWVVDGSGRPIQTQECTASASQGQQCSGALLITNESWDSDDNLVSTVDARGFETDYAYDSLANTIAVAQPQMTTSQGTFRPTSLYSYDSFNNVTAYCDPGASHALSRDWTSTPSGDALCPITSLLATRYIWSTDPTQSGSSSANPSYEPFGELLARVEPGTAAASSGYRVNYTYDSSRQGGVDYGLPTTVSAAVPISQADGTQRQPAQNFWYDNNGWLGCYSKGSGSWVLAYDSLGRPVSTADPDDSAAGAGICSKAGGMSGWSTASTTAYFPDGSVSSKQSASQRAAGVGTNFTYDADGNESSETHHYGCTSVSSCTAGVTNKWYDGTDRLVEVALPYDANDIQGYPMMTRYIYDLSQSGTTPYQSLGLPGYGNLVKTQELLSGTVITPFTYATYSSFVPYSISTGTWTDVRATSFDGLDRPLSSYEAAFASLPKIANTYDGVAPGGGAAQLGLLSSVTLATNEVKQYTYDPVGHLSDTTYSNDNGATSPAHVRYDASGRVVSRGTDDLGNEVLQYDFAGELLSVTKPAALGSAKIAYDYYSDGMRKDLNFSSPVYTANLLYQYAYRTDGRRSALMLMNGSAFAWTYTQAGRLRSQTDPFTGKSIAPDNYYTVGKSPAQHPYYPTSVTYVPESYSFDNYGRTIGVTFPAGVFSQSVTSFDLEDGVAAMSDLSVQAPTNVTTVICATSNIRNEKLPASGGACNRGFSNGAFYNGAVFAGQIGVVDPPGATLAPWTLDARAGMLKGWQGQTLADGNMSSGQFSYDASGRLTGDAERVERPWRASDGSMPGDRVYTTGTRTKTYDAENRLRTQQTSPAVGATYPLWGENNPGGYWNDMGQGASDLLAVDYSADSHPVRFAAQQPADYGNSSPSQTFVWLWDGNDVLAQCGYDNTGTQCAGYGFPVEGLGTYYPSTGYLSVADRDLTGQIVTGHDARGFTAASLGRPSRNYFFGGVNASVAQGSVSPDDGGPPLPPVGARISGTKMALDGWTFGNNTWQGVRTYDASVGQWNTPDAYAGNVHDPMSQKPFMWNRNNPYAYSDPTGFDPCSNGITGCPGSSESRAWQLPPALRGRALEKEAGQNLPYPFPGVDRSDPPPNGFGLPPTFASVLVTSIKSLDTRSSSYQSFRGLASKLKGYVDSLAGMPSGEWQSFGSAILIDSSTQRQLTVVIPKTAVLTTDQQDAFNLISGYAASNNIIFTVQRK